MVDGCLKPWFSIGSIARLFSDEEREQWLLDEPVMVRTRFQSLSDNDQYSSKGSETPHVLTTSNLPTSSLMGGRLPLMVIGALANRVGLYLLAVSDRRRSGRGTSSFCSARQRIHGRDICSTHSVKYVGEWSRKFDGKRKAAFRVWVRGGELLGRLRPT